MTPKLLNQQQLADSLRLNRHSIKRNLLGQWKDIPRVKIGRRKLFDYPQVITYLETKFGVR